METVFRAWEEIAPTENHVEQLHRDLLRHSEKDERHRGEYKKLPNSVAALGKRGRQVGIVFETATLFETPRLMAELVDWYVDACKRRQLHPLAADRRLHHRLPRNPSFPGR